jgi:hypothetical protein
LLLLNAAKSTSTWRVQSPRVGELSSYWEGKRGHRAMPCRSDIDPAEIKHLLPSLLIGDLLQDPLRVRYRLAGTHICEAFGFNVTGRWLHDLDVAGDLAFWEAQYGRMMATRAPVFGSTVGSVGNVEYFRSDWVLLPLSHDGVVPHQSLEMEDWVRNRPTAKFNDPEITWRVFAGD